MGIAKASRPGDNPHVAPAYIGVPALEEEGCIIPCITQGTMFVQIKANCSVRDMLGTWCCVSNSPLALGKRGAESPCASAGLAQHSGSTVPYFAIGSARFEPHVLRKSRFPVAETVLSAALANVYSVPVP